MTQLIRVMIADDHPVILFGTGLALAKHAVIEVVGQAKDSTELVALLQKTPCDIVVTDLAMPGGAYGDGLPFVEYLARRYPHVKVIVLTMLENPGILKRLQGANVKGVVNKSDDMAHIGAAVLAVMKGGSYLGPSIRAAFENAGFSEDQATPAVALSKRESEVVRLFVSGKKINEIAAQLHRSVKTISTQKSNAMRKLGLERDADLYQYALGNGLVNLPSVGTPLAAAAPTDALDSVPAPQPGTVTAA